MAAVEIKVITYAPTVFYHCQHCELTFSQIGIGDRIHREEARDALPEDLRRDFEELSAWVHRLIECYGDRVSIRVIDAASIEGVWKSLRYGLRRYPAVVIDGTDTHAGGDLKSLEHVIERYVSVASRA
jgi:hypothetical protein